MILRWAAILFSTLSLAASTSKIERDRLYIWSVGQGSWGTLISVKYCLHFDMGGEFFVRHSALNLCRQKLNVLYISHLDSDHISLIKPASRLFRELCLVNKTSLLRSSREIIESEHLKKISTRKPLNKFAQAKYQAGLRKIDIIRSLSDCDQRQIPTRVRNIMFRTSPGFLKTTNDASEIYILDKRWLFSGDSPKKAEKIWAPLLGGQPTDTQKNISINSSKSKIEFLIVGHHGSRTSTSEELIAALPNLKMAIVSARRKKYRHPHFEVIELFQKNKTPLLLTEKWGHLIFEL